MTTTVLNLRTQKCLELGLEGKKQIIQCNKEVELESGVWIRETWENKNVFNAIYRFPQLQITHSKYMYCKR